MLCCLQDSARRKLPHRNLGKRFSKCSIDSGHVEIMHKVGTSICCLTIKVVSVTRESSCHHIQHPCSLWGKVLDHPTRSWRVVKPTRPAIISNTKSIIDQQLNRRTLFLRLNRYPHCLLFIFLNTHADLPIVHLAFLLQSVFALEDVI